MKSRFYVIIILICLAFQFTVAQGQFSWINYNTSSGMASNSALRVSSDNFNNIWVSVGGGSGNGVGLQKFDGNNWVLYNTANSGLISNTVNNVKADSQGNLWITYFGGTGSSVGGLSKFDGNTWTTFNTFNSNILSNVIADIEIDDSDNIWLSCQFGISKFDGTIFTNYIIPHSGTLLIEDSSSVWIGGYGLTHYNPLNNIWIHYDPSNSNIPSYNVSAIAKDSSGLIWVGLGISQGGPGTGGSNGSLATFDGTSFSQIWPFTNPYTNVMDVEIDESNQVWVSTRCEGVYKFDNFSWQNIPGVPNCLYDMVLDHSNNVWVVEPNTGVWTYANPTGIFENRNLSSFKIFPNPGSETITVNGLFEADDRIIVHNTFGDNIFESEVEIGLLSYEMDITNYNSGIYFLKILRSQNEFITRKFIVTR